MANVRRQLLRLDELGHVLILLKLAVVQVDVLVLIGHDTLDFLPHFLQRLLHVLHVLLLAQVVRVDVLGGHLLHLGEKALAHVVVVVHEGVWDVHALLVQMRSVPSVGLNLETNVGFSCRGNVVLRRGVVVAEVSRRDVV